MSKEQEALEKVKEEIQTLAEDAGFWDKNYWKQIDGFEILQQALGDLKLYKTALKISCNNDALLRNGEVLEQMYLDQARKELNNGK